MVGKEKWDKVKCRLFLLFCIENCNFQINIDTVFEACRTDK